MSRLRPILIALALLGIAGPLAGCAGTTEDPAATRESVRQIESLLKSASLMLPSIPVEIGSDGRVERIAGFPTRTVDNMAQRLTGNPLVGRIVVVDPAYLKWFDKADLQHATVALRPDGLFVLVNGRPLPRLAWDEETLDNLVEVLGKFQKDPAGEKFALITPQAYEAIKAALPLIKTLNLRFDIRLPDYPEIGPPDRRAIPLPDAAALEAVETADVSEEGTPLQLVDLEIAYRPLLADRAEAGWVPSIFGFSTLDLQRIADSLAQQQGERVKVPQMRLREDIRRRLEDEGIASLGLESRSDGLFMTVHGQLLPHLAWDEASLTNLSGLLGRLYPEGLSKLPDDARWVPIVRRTAPMYNDYDLALIVRFPVGE